MHPALSVIFFTVTAGAGYGFLMLLAIIRYTDNVTDLSVDQLVFGGVIGLVLVTAGLLSSTFHLANPRNAWRSFTRFRTSWLSREAVFAILFYPLSLAWLISEWFSGATGLSIVLGWLTVIMALVVLLCTAMIYASLKTIRQWHSPLVPVVYVLLGLSLGALVLLVYLSAHGLIDGTMLKLTATLLALAALVKIAYFMVIGKPAGPSINTALGFTKATVKLLDVGHSSGTFLTDEFGFQVARTRIFWLRIITLVCAFLIPVLIVTGIFGEPGTTSLSVALAFGWFGISVERWLFFAEARHVVNLYHGAQAT